MNLNVLLEQYQNNPRLFQLADKLSFAQSQRIFLKNLQGSSAEFVVTAVFNHTATSTLNHVVVLNDAEEAAYFHNTLENLTQALDLFYFPSSFKNRKNFRILNSSHVMLRTEALTKLAAGGNKKILVTYPEAIFEKVVLPKTLSSNIITIKTNDSINPESLMELFVMYGFERTDFVYEPGQFAVRGGILDIYSFGNEKPYRIELFGNEVDSIRIFDPETQLSERKLLQVNIIPNVETQFSTDEKVSLFDFLSENTIVWLKDWDVIAEKVQQQYDEMEGFMQLLKEGYQMKSNEEEEDIRVLKEVSAADFVPLTVISEQLEKRHIVEFGYKPQLSNTEIEFTTRPQPAFNRQFDLLIKDLTAHEAAKYSIYIFAEQVKQLERLNSIFADLKTEIQFVPVPSSIHEGFIDEDLKIVCYTDHQIFQRYHKYKVKQAYNKNKALTLKTLRDLQPGDYVTHIDHGVGTYSGLQKLEVNGKLQEAVRIIYKDSDILYVNINSLHKISKYTGKEGTVPKINKLGSDVWVRLKEKTKTKVKEIAFDLIKLYAQRKAQEGFAHTPDNYLQTELEASFIYEDTPDQSKATADVKKDMESLSPMDRLVCGDVGFGKTEIAVRAAFKSVVDGKQAAVLVPTTILAFQHYKTFKDRLKDFPVTVDYINRFKSAKEKKETLKKVEEGKVDIIVGTHGLLGKEVKFKDLGIMIIDEEQKFGVAHKEKLKTLKTNVDCLTLTATPIPRTLQFSLMGARDLSIINTPPPNRQPIQTEVHVFNDDFIREAIYYETERGGQVFFIHNRVVGLSEMSAMLQGLCPDLSIGYAHGQLEGHELEERIMDFIDKKYDVLVCTNIVESGVDIPNVNTIIVNNAHQFGLSDLHQLRGRVGRSNKKAFCYLLAPPMSTLPADSRKRLQTLEQFSDLGSGFQIAMRDLDIRGAGNLLGGEQSGFMAEIGFEMYQKILEEAIRELKRTSFKDLFKEEISKQDDYVSDCTIDTDLEILIPDSYVESIAERLSLYSRLDNCEKEEELQDFHKEMIDRFGPMPSQVEDLFTTVRCRWSAVDIGFEKMTLKQDTLRCYFINRPDSPYFESDLFKRVLAYLQTGTNKARLKQAGKNFLLVVDDVRDMESMLRFLNAMHREVVKMK
ncbi:MAG: transcription-repair coupling factor [Sediminibacterium sp. Gen4]|uniref:transcription-repair coupling factor n=1 Tax=unclassified Sediminibacterium TaxID=2635961 RepID=UPI0015BBD3CD|nr:transcription-repair coupling factor [Sediminibacterium sp.]MBW0163565.1 transcription-repair coupling factor [Sediminibacterium sp.]NWK66659.1 transcription-repair coupling factor [Sediminibacterium sp. Gen4]